MIDFGLSDDVIRDILHISDPAEEPATYEE